jgi:4-amino-4-deoxy-L-arabinose transferase-like glycosyltransferase
MSFGARITRRDAAALLSLAGLLAAMLLGTWQRWTQPIIDHGREMNLPARLLAGEQLYSDVQFLYGPFAPYFNAALYRVCGVRLTTLHASGAVCAALVLLLTYWLARQLTSEGEAALAAALTLVLCAVKATANYVSPYAYAALYGLVFALFALACAVRWLQSRRDGWLCLAGLGAGLALACKLDLFLPAAAAGGAAWLIGCLTERRILWRALLLFALPALLAGGGAYALILTRVEWRALVEDNYALFYNFPPQLIYYNRRLGGFADWPRSLAKIGAALGIFVLLCGACALAGMKLAGRGQRLAAGASPRAWAAAVGGFGLWVLAVAVCGADGDASPLLLPLVIGVAARRWRRQAGPGGAPESQIVLVVAVFGLASVARILLNVTTSNAYSPFVLPAVIVVYLHVLFRAAPAWLLRGEGARLAARRAAMGLMAVAVAATAVGSIVRLHKRHTYEIASARGRFLTLPHLGQPLAQAIRYVESHTAPTQPVLVLPQGTSINFLTARRQPVPEEILLPGFLAGAKEAARIRRLAADPPPLILVVNSDSSEFRDRAFGVDYNQGLMKWVRENYRVRAVFGRESEAEARLGGGEFFILAFERKE